MEDDILDGTQNYSEECDYHALKNKVADVLRKYFQYDDRGEPNASYDPNFEPQAALDEIHEIIGKI